MIKRSVYELAAVCGGRVYNCLCDFEIGIIVNNDKHCVKNCCYASIDGENHKGNEFVLSAVKNGATVILCQTPPNENIPYVLVPSVSKALCDIAAYYRVKELKNVVAVTGSVGKTTVKEMCASVIAQSGAVLKTEGNKNNLLGLPLTVLSNTDSEIAVLEAGISERGEMDRLANICRPDVAVITNIGLMHGETLGSREDIAREKLKIIGDGAKCTLIVPVGEPLLSQNNAYKTVTVGYESENADYSVFNAEFTEDGSLFDVKIKGGDIIEGLFVSVIGRHGCIDGAFAVAVGKTLGISENEIRNGLMRYKTVGDRQNITVKNGFTVMRDCYNFGPESANAALEAFSVLCDKRKPCRSVAMLGSMLELGKISESEHIKLGKHIAKSKITHLITVGDLAQNIALGALIGGMDKENVYAFKDGERSEAKAALDKLCISGSALLLKGSRGMKMEEFLI